MSVGIDAKLVALDGTYDLIIDSNGDIETEDTFDAAIIVSLFADRRADASEVPTPQFRRGWVGNESTPGIEMGSKIWIYLTSRITSQTLVLISDAAREALQWLIADVFAFAVDAKATNTGTTVNLAVTIERTNSKVEKRFYDLWEATGV